MFGLNRMRVRLLATHSEWGLDSKRLIPRSHLREISQRKDRDSRLIMLGAYSIVLPSRCTTAGAHVCHPDRDRVIYKVASSALVIRRGRWLHFLRKEQLKARRVPRTRFRASWTPSRQRSSKRNASVKTPITPLHGGFVNWISTNRKLIEGNCTRRFSAVSFSKRAVSKRAPFASGRVPDRLCSRLRKMSGGGGGGGGGGGAGSGAALIFGDVRESPCVSAACWWLKGRKRYANSR